MSFPDRKCGLAQLILCVLVAMLAGCASGPGGVKLGGNRSAETTLAACPSRPSCVVSRDDAGSHAIEPLTFDGPVENALARVGEILATMPRTRIVDSGEHYLHAIQESGLLHFTDDIEFLLDPSTGRIDVRSCSRLGYYDFGVNRARIEALRAALEAPR